MQQAEASVDVNIIISTEDKTCQIEIIEVRDENKTYPATHYLLIETEVRSTTWSVRNMPMTSSDIKVRATYLYGSSGIFKAGHLISETGGKMQGSQGTVRLTNGSVLVDDSMRGLHLGTYLFHKIVSWAKQFEPTYTIVPISVIAGDAGKENKDRRNKLYINSGIRFQWNDEKDMGGRSDPTLCVADLIAYANWPNIDRHHGMRALDKIWQELSNLKTAARDLRASNRYYRKKYKTIYSRLRGIADFINPLICLFCIAAGFMIGKAMG